MATKAQSTSTTAKNAAGSTTKGASTAKDQAAATTPGSDAETLLKADHRKVEQLFKTYESAGSTEQKQQTARQICTELIVHSRLEEEIFYPACREKNVESDLLDEAQVEHDTAKLLIGELMTQSPDDEFYDAKVSVLCEYIKHHVGEEEKTSDGIFAKAREAEVDMAALGSRIHARKQELLSRAESMEFAPPQPRSLELDYIQESQFMEGRYDRDRDQRGRFTSDDDYGRRSSSRSSGRSRYDDDDDRRSSRSSGRDRDEYGRFTSDDDDDRRYSRSGGRDRDERGRFMSDDDDRDNGRRSSRSGDRDRDEYGRFTSDDDNGRRFSRSGGRDRDEYGRFTSDDDDDRRSSGSRGRGEGSGWYGESRGHSEAARRGWAERGGSSRYSRSRDDDDDDRRGSRGGRSQGGWFGDPEGHAEAARRGWEDRDDDDGSSRSSSRGSSRYDDDDDDRRGSRGGSSSRGSSRSPGGWFGDSEGHAEAARRGWRNRD
jgi:hypothetical protein